MSKVNSSDIHENCVTATTNDIKIDHDALLIDIEGDPIEEFKQASDSNQV